MAKAFLIDLDYCNGCYSCQYACKDEHVGNTWLPYALPQPNTGQFWMRVDEKEHGSKPRVRVEYTLRPCMHCDNCPLLELAPDAVYRREDGLVIVDPVKAVGRKELIDACPYGVVYWNEELQIPQKCTGCAHLVDKGQLPHCVDVCGQGALRFGEEQDFAEEIARAEVLQPELGTRPRVYYLNRPRLFICGEVWDKAADEIIEGARVELTLPDGSSIETYSDDFGEFWFKRLEPGMYALHIEYNGFRVLDRSGIRLSDKGLNLGDFPLGN